ncbi:hypothetical protein [Acinetobacter sp.]|uniref:hypothetical protein n=1 Tax=Acinetobacter sp. TaxID=472 RepID=UPI0035B42543
MKLDRNADCPAQGKEFDPEEMRRCKNGGHTIIKQPDAIQISCPAACRFRRRLKGAGACTRLQRIHQAITVGFLPGIKTEKLCMRQRLPEIFLLGACSA